MPRYIPYMPVDSPERVAGSLELRKIKNQLGEDLKTLNLAIDPKSTPEKRKKAAKKLYFKYNKKRNKFSLNPDKDFEDLYIDPVILKQLYEELGELKDATKELLRKTMLNYANNSFLSPYYLQSPVKSNTLEGALGYFNVAKNATTELFSTTAFMVSPAFSSLLLGSLGYMASDKVAKDAGLTGTNRKITGIAGGAATGLLSYLTHGAFKNIRKTLELIDKMEKGPIDVPYTELNSDLIKNTQKYLPANSEIYFLVTGNRPLLPAPKLTSHVLGDEAVKMFKKYGGTKIPENSINGELLRMYVPEARERYGLVGNTNITDEEIAEALYKHSLELGGNTAAVNALGEPLLLFRGNTKDVIELRPRKTPEEFINIGGTMDNSLGTLFLGELPNAHTDNGPYRYLVRGTNFRGNNTVLSAGGGNETYPIINGVKINAPSEGRKGEIVSVFPKGTILVIEYPKANYRLYKLPSENTSTGYNHVDSYIVNTPAVRDVTSEIKTIPGDPEKWLYTPFQWLIPQKERIGLSERLVLAKQYLKVLEEAQKLNLGLLKSDKGTVYRGDEHGGFDYFALPNFNLNNIKHILPYDLRTPRDWNDPNVYRDINVHSSTFYDPRYPSLRDAAIAAWNARYPNSGLKIETPRLTTGADNESIVYIGKLPFSDEVKATTELMKQRWNRFNYDKSALDIIGGYSSSVRDPNKFFDLLTSDSRATNVYLPLTKGSNTTGFYDNFDRSLWLRLYPERPKPYIYSLLHEGVVHPTDEIVEKMTTAVANRKVMEPVARMMGGLKNSNSMYGKLSFPNDIYPQEMIEKYLSHSALKPREARAMNWEEIMKIYSEIAKKYNISYKDAITTKKDVFEKTIDDMSLNEFKNLLLRMDNAYVRDYVKLMNAGTEDLANLWLRRFKGALKYGPIVTGAIAGTAASNNRYGGKLIKKI